MYLKQQNQRTISLKTNSIKQPLRICFTIVIAFTSPSNIFISAVTPNIIAWQCIKIFNFICRTWKKARKQALVMVLPRSDLPQKLASYINGWGCTKFLFSFFFFLWGSSCKKFFFSANIGRNAYFRYNFQYCVYKLRLHK